jgi:hypothetical protein
MKRFRNVVLITKFFRNVSDFAAMTFSTPCRWIFSLAAIGITHFERLTREHHSGELSTFPVFYAAREDFYRRSFYRTHVMYFSFTLTCNTLRKIKELLRVLAILNGVCAFVV